MRNDEKEAKTCEDQKKNFFNRLAQRFQNPETELKDGEFKAPMATENLVQKYSVVKSKELNSVREPWMKKRACLGNNKDNELAKHIFKLCQHNGEIKSSNFIRLLVEIGVPLPCKIIIETLENLFNTKKLENFIMGENAIIRICKSDTLSKRFMGKILEDAEKILKVDNNDNSKREVNALDVEKLLKVWWQEADTYGRNQLHLNEISEFLLRKGIVADQTEGRKLLSKIFKDLVYIDYNHFLLIFSKPLIKYSLSILWKKVLNESKESMYFSNDYSLTTLKKKILLAGINYPTTEFTADEGIYAINAIEKYKDVKSSTEKMTYDDFCKYWSLTSGQECGKNFLKRETKLEKKEKVLSVFKKNDDIESEISSDECEVKDKVPVFTKNERYTILGNFNISTLGAYKWRHSVSPNITQFTVSTSDGESKIRNQQKVFNEFLMNSK
ncbi:hypothetical protein SteCoe_27101 [Stentor coeruleus]|uniref:Uncharacterized protein n=1 Tax=Stentor coeruleus TaxID=5963 RepID=A0A1R2BB97_9CILI|nr:hypothetical protein SteCoe_27101 [Stentor coeruleus]